MKKETDQDCCQNRVPTEYAKWQEKSGEKDQDKDKKQRILSAREDYLYKMADTIQERACPYGTKQQGEYTLEDYYALPDDQRVELIDGVFFEMQSPTIAHQLAEMQTSRYLQDYIDQEGGSCIVLVAPVDVQLDRDDRTMVQPDVLVVCDRDILLNRCVYGAPDLIVEILSPSTSRKDSVIKLKKYREAGVREYWMVDLEKKRVTVYEFERRDVPVIYGMDQEIPAGIFDGKCLVDMRAVCEKISFLNA